MIKYNPAFLRCLLQTQKWGASTSTPACRTKKRKIIDETSIAGAQHKASMSGPSLGYLISELSATRSGMEALRQEGQTMSEEHRTQARQVVKCMVGIPLAFGGTILAIQRIRN